MRRSTYVSISFGSSLPTVLPTTKRVMRIDWKILMQILLYLCIKIFQSMRITLLVVGKTVGNELPKMIETYVGRLKHYIPFDIQVIPDLKNTTSLSDAQQKQQEGEAILRAVEGSFVVLLDEHGKEYRSLTFAEQLQTWLNTSTRGLTFVIGGAYGFSEAVYQRADAKISLSQMTFSHQMIRLLFVEQLYRAMTILRGEPYHHE